MLLKPFHETCMISISYQENKSFQFWYRLHLLTFALCNVQFLSLKIEIAKGYEYKRFMFRPLELNLQETIVESSHFFTIVMKI